MSVGKELGEDSRRRPSDESNRTEPSRTAPSPEIAKSSEPASKAPSILSTTDPILQEAAAQDDAADAADAAEAARPALSRASTQRPAVVPVPRSERRGLFSRLTVIPEVTKPVDYPNRTKWLITALVSLAGVAAPFGGSIVVPALQTIASDLHAPATVVNLNFALYMLSMAIFPLWWSSFSETVGRRSVYIVSFALFTAMAAVGAVAPNIGMLVAFRTLGGGASASVHAVGAGTLADIWEPRERGRAMGMFYLGPLCGPFLAPIVGGAMTQGLGWRSTQWALTVYGGVTLAGMTFGLPETLRRKKARGKELPTTERPVLDAPEKDAASARGVNATPSRPSLTRTSTRQSVRRHTRRSLVLLHRWLIDPLSVVTLFRFPAISLTILLVSILMGCLAALNIAIQYSFSHPPYSFSTTAVGLLYIPNSLGYILASVLGGRWLDHIMAREAQRARRRDAAGKLVYRPEDRVRENAWAGALSYPAALVWYGWAAGRGAPWPAAMAANFVFGVGSMLIFALATTMLTEFLPRRASAGIALNNLVRNVFACAGGVAAEPWIVAAGSGWVFTALGAAGAVIGVGVILAFRRYSGEWMVKMEEALAKEED